MRHEIETNVSTTTALHNLRDLKFAVGRVMYGRVPTPLERAIVNVDRLTARVIVDGNGTFLREVIRELDGMGYLG